MKTSLLPGPIQSVQCTDLKLVEWIEYIENIRSRRKTQNIGQGVIQHYELYYKFTRSIFSLNLKQTNELWKILYVLLNI